MKMEKVYLDNDSLFRYFLFLLFYIVSNRAQQVYNNCNAPINCVRPCGYVFYLRTISMKFLDLAFDPKLCIFFRILEM